VGIGGPAQTATLLPEIARESIEAALRVVERRNPAGFTAEDLEDLSAFLLSAARQQQELWASLLARHGAAAGAGEERRGAVRPGRGILRRDGARAVGLPPRPARADTGWGGGVANPAVGRPEPAAERRATLATPSSALWALGLLGGSVKWPATPSRGPPPRSGGPLGLQSGPYGSHKVRLESLTYFLAGVLFYLPVPGSHPMRLAFPPPARPAKKSG
jgi:hypothetical protein